MGDEDEVIAALIGHLANTLSPTADVREKSESFLFSWFQSAPFDFVVHASSLLLRDDVPPAILQAAVICVNRALTPTCSSPLPAIISVFMDPSREQPRGVIRQSLFRGLMFADQGLRQSSAYSVALLFQIERESWFSIFPALITLSESPGYPEEAHHGAICAFREILASGFPLSLVPGDTQQFFELFVRILASRQPVDPLVLVESARTFTLFLAKTIDALGSDDVGTVLHMIEVMMACEQQAVFVAALDCLLVIVRGLYDHIEPLLARVFDLAILGLLSGNLQRQLSVLNFWDELAQFESCADSPTAIMRRAAKPLFPVIIEFMNMLEEDFDIEAIDFASPPIIAVNCLSSLYCAAPAKIAAATLSLWRGARTWRAQVNALLGAIAIAIADSPCPDVGVPFFREIFDNLVVFARSDVDLFCLFGLKVLEKAISVFHVELDCLSDAEFLSAVVFQAAGRSPAIVNAACEFVEGLCRLSFRENEKSPLGEVFDPTVSFVLQLLTQGPFIPCGLTALSFIVSFAPPSRLDVCEQAVSIVEQIVELCDCPGELLFAIEAAVCDVVRAVAGRLEQGLGGLVPRSMQLLLGLVGRDRTAIFEETLDAMCAIVYCCKEEFEPFVGDVIKVLWDMLHTENLQIIQAALVILADLFRFLPRAMEQYTRDVFDIGLGVAEENVGEVSVRLLNSLSEIASCERESLPEEIKEHLFVVLGRILVETPVNVSTLEGMEATRDFFADLLSAYRFAIESVEREFLITVIDKLFMPINAFIASKAFCSKTFLPLFSLLKEIALKVGQRATKSLNQRRIRAVLEQAKLSKDDQVARLADDLTLFLPRFHDGDNFKEVIERRRARL
jgi:hypothetical protein